MLAKADGAGPASAFKVKSVSEEYQILAALGLKSGSQSLVMRGAKPYDVLNAVDPRTGAERQIWFDISSFFGNEF